MSIFNEGIKRNQGKVLRKEDKLNPLTGLKCAGKYVIKADNTIIWTVDHLNKLK